MSRRALLALVLVGVPAAAQEKPPAAPAAPVDAGAVVAAAKERFDALDERAALELLKPLLGVPAADAAALELAARCQVELGRPDEALAALDRIAKPSAATRIARARALAAKGEGKRALALLDELLVGQPLHVDARLERIRALLAEDDLRGANDAILDLRRSERDRGELLLFAARVAERRHQLSDAYHLYEMVAGTPWRAAALDAHDLRDAIEGAGRVAFRGGKYEAALRWQRELVKRAPRSASARFQLGMSEAMASRTGEAIATLKEALALDPGHDECRMRLAELYRTSGMIEESAAEFERLRALPAWRLDATRYLAELAMKTGELERALAFVQEIEAVDPPTAAVLETCGLVREQAGDTPRAKADLRRCLELDPLRFSVLYKLALLLGRSDSAEERAQGAEMMASYLKTVPVLPDLESAVAAIQLMPDNPVQMVHLAGVLNVGGQYESAQVWIDKALRTTPDDARAHAIAGCIAANRGKDPEALRHFERAQALIGGVGDPKVRGYIETLKNGQKLPLPLGEIQRSAKASGSVEGGK
jgi:tetratricopeptide (TPR) repeat protein